MVGLDRSEWK